MSKYYNTVYEEFHPVVQTEILKRFKPWAGQDGITMPLNSSLKNLQTKTGIFMSITSSRGLIIHNRQSSKSIFFEWDRNTVDIGGELQDKLEQLAVSAAQ